MNMATMNGATLNGYEVKAEWVSGFADKVFTLPAGVSNLRPNIRATSMIVVLENSRNTGEWALEDMNGVSVDAGRRRDTVTVGGAKGTPTSSFADAEYTLSAGVNEVRPNMRGTSMVIVLENADALGSWALENIEGVSVDAGRRR